MSSREDLENYRSIIEILSDSLYMIREIYDRKAFLVSASNEIEIVKWRGIPLLLKETIQELVNSLGDAISYALAIKFLGVQNPELTKSYVRELLLRLDEMAEWEYDKVVSLLEASLSTHYLGLMEESNNTLEKALSLIHTIPDRSDKSIALAKAIKILAMKKRVDEAIKLIDEIYYDPKRIEAVYSILDYVGIDQINNELVSTLEKKLSDYEIPIFRAKLAYRLAKHKPKTAKNFCSKLLSRTDFSKLLGLREVLSFRWCIKALIEMKDSSIVNSVIVDYINALRQRIDDREIINSIRDVVISYHSVFNSNEDLVGLINQIINQVSVESTYNKHYILNRLANLKWYLGLKNEAIYMFKNNFMEANRLEYPISTYTIMDVGVNVLEIANNFPEHLDPETVLAVKGALLPAERQSIEVSLSREYLKFLKEAGRGEISVYLERVLNKEIIESEMDLNKKAKEFILTLVNRGQQIVLHYVLKFIYKIPMNEHERTNYLNLLGRAVELMTKDLKDQAKPYIELILDKLERSGYPVFAIPIELLHDYILKLM